MTLQSHVSPGQRILSQAKVTDGGPGVGKTCTAECIAAFTKRPLMVLTSSDISTDPSMVEGNLTRQFKTAKSWGAVLLIDEADVFMERRSTADLVRNSLVAGFLRALEFYDGILFLTTNRVGSFDDAFISRVHLQLYYPDFDDDQRRQVWQTFVDKLAKERRDTMRLNVDAKDYIRGAEMRALKWNGREIRNAFQTAVSLAEYDAEKGEDGKIMVTDEHLRAVVELSKDFKDYLNTLHQGDEGKRAERKFDRLGSHGH
ncbi:putative aaa family atpase protein [Eutypa lata UCREL1]|uniref:Putative aaa family atpase protein n=1 Tax=Eutypa lata (strain UCR-EL1) TaxID=1287681 RepID=M7T220_EUTLA|nr:putative aaa family atpase protein [Eutypa lata UCREL1]